jgi:hypothetical protein
MLRLNIFSGNADTAAPDDAPKEIHPSENTEPRAATDKRKPEWKSTASATAKMILRGVRDSSDAFAPLKSAGGLCFILENCEVRPPRIPCSDSHTHPSARRETRKR